MNSVFCPCLFLNVNFALEDFDDWKVEFFCEIPVSCVVGRNGHDCACSVRNKNIVCNPDWNKLAVYRVDCIASAEYTCLVFCKVSTLKVRFFCCLIDIFFDGFFLLWSCESFYKFVFRRDYHVGSTEESVASCCVDCELLVGRLSVFVCNGEVDFGTF